MDNSVSPLSVRISDKELSSELKDIGVQKDITGMPPKLGGVLIQGVIAKVLLY